MESFYKEWLKKNKEDNQIAKSQLQQEEDNQIEDSMDQTQDEAVIEPEQLQETYERPENIVYETEELQLIIEKGTHLRQIKFRLEDHMFHMKIKLKNNTKKHPMLRDILEFLEKGFNYILLHIRKFYNENEHNIAYLTLYQEPMISGLNTGN